MAALDEMDSHQKGDYTEAVVIAELQKRDIPVCMPFGDNERYDAVVEQEDDFLSIQIKTGWLSDGKINFHCRSQHTNSQGNTYKKYDGDVDFFVVYCHKLESMYLIAEDAFDSTMRLRVEEPQQRDRTINWAEDYAFDANWPPESTTRPQERDGRRVVDRLEACDVTVARVTTDDRPYDLLLEHPNGDFLRTTIRPGYLIDGRIRFDTGHTTGPAPGETDLVLVDCQETGELYLVRRDEYDATISFRVTEPTEVHADTKWAAEYEFTARWPDGIAND